LSETPIVVKVTLRKSIDIADSVSIHCPQGVSTSSIDRFELFGKV